MEINYTLVIIATLLQFIVGAIWYSPLMFGKWWMEIMEATNISKEELAKMQKEMGPFYALQFFLTFFTTFSFINLVPYIPTLTMYHLAWWIFIGFIFPVQIGTVIWGKTKKKFWLKQIFVMGTYQLTILMLMSFILSL